MTAYRILHESTLEDKRQRIILVCLHGTVHCTVHKFYCRIVILQYPLALRCIGIHTVLFDVGTHQRHITAVCLIVPARIIKAAGLVIYIDRQAVGSNGLVKHCYHIVH